MFVGYKVYSWQKQGVVLPKYRIFSFISMMIFPSIFLIFCSGRIFYEPVEMPLVSRVLYAMLLRPVLGVITAYIIVSLALRLEDSVRCFVEWRGFVPLGRLSYMVYLLNVGFVQMLQGQRTHLQHISGLNMVVTYLGVNTLSFLVAVPCFLMVEAPSNRLTKAIFESTTAKQLQKKKTQ